VDTDLPNNELVERNPAWAAAREAAQRFLNDYDDTAERERRTDIPD